MKLSRPLTLLALAAVLPLTILSAALGVSGLRQEQQAMQAAAEARVDLTSALIERDLERQVAVLSLAAQSPLFDGPLDRQALADYLDRIGRSQPLWRRIALSDVSGRRLSVPVGDDAYADHVAEMDSLNAVVRTGRPALGRIMRRPDGRLGFAARVPVIRGGKLLYVLSAVVDPDELRRLLAGAPLPEGWRAGLIDASGRVVARINAPQDPVGGFATADTLRNRERASSGFARTLSIEGEPVVSAFKVLPDSHWSIHAAIPLRLYQAPVVRSGWILAGTAVVALMLAFLFLWLLSRELGLRQRQARAEEESRRMEALGRMTGGVAHDFNNLLMIVQGSAEMMKRRRDDPERVGVFANAVLSAAQRGQALTRQLLAFARRNSHEALDFRLQERAATLAELIRRSVGDKVALELAVPADAWAVHTDPDALEIALINLAVNARDAMAEGGQLSIAAANLTCRRGRGPAPGLEGDFVAIAVRDTGAGIPEEHLGHIFEPFYTTKPTGRGTGLGLSQVYGFAKQSGGAVTVASRAGEGSVFTLYLPRAVREPAAAPPPPSVSPPVRAGSVLLVEDDPDVARAIEAMLANGGYVVTWAPDRQAALDLAGGQHSFDVVLSDTLGDQSGCGLLAALRRDRPGMGTVLMTGRPDDAETGEGVLMKPFGPEQMFAALDRARTVAGATRPPHTLDV